MTRMSEGSNPAQVCEQPSDIRYSAKVLGGPVDILSERNHLTMSGLPCACVKLPHSAGR